MSLKKFAVVLICFAGLRMFSSRQLTEFTDLTANNLITVSEQEFSNLEAHLLESWRPSPLFEKYKLRRAKNKKVAAALLAFPFPCGIVGLHRIYLGSAPYVPIVYIATIGGAFGILPFIDFCVLLIDNDIEPYINNNKVFMWVN